MTSVLAAVLPLLEAEAKGFARLRRFSSVCPMSSLALVRGEGSGLDAAGSSEPSSTFGASASPPSLALSSLGGAPFPAAKGVGVGGVAGTLSSVETARALTLLRRKDARGDLIGGGLAETLSAPLVSGFGGGGTGEVNDGLL